MTDTSVTMLERAARGDAVAWRRLDDIYRPLVRGWLRRRGVHPQEADDLTQDILFAVYRGLERFRHPGTGGSFRAWLRTITVNRVREFARAGRVRPNAPGGDFLQVVAAVEDPDSPASAEWDREHDAAVVRRLLEQLAAEFDPRTMTAFRLTALERRPGAGVAAELGMSVGAVYAARSRVLSRLRAVAGDLLE